MTEGELRARLKAGEGPWCELKASVRTEEVREAFVRVGSETKTASRELFEELIADRTETARLLRPWIGRMIRVEHEYEPSPGRRQWPNSATNFTLLGVDAVGLKLATDGLPIVADWARVRLQPIISDQPPVIRISID